MTKTKKVKDIESDDVLTFTLKQLVDSEKYRRYEYLLNVYLKDTDRYTLAEVDKILSGLI